LECKIELAKLDNNPWKFDDLVDTSFNLDAKKNSTLLGR